MAPHKAQIQLSALMRHLFKTCLSSVSPFLVSSHYLFHLLFPCLCYAILPHRTFHMIFANFWPMVTNDTLWTLSGFKCISRFYVVWFCDYWSKFVLASLGGMGVESLRVDWLIIFPNKAGRDIQNGSTKWHHRNTRTIRKKGIMTSPKDHTFQPPNSKRWTGKVTQ